MSVDEYRHAAASLISLQAEVSAEMTFLLKDPDSIPDEALQVVEAACLLTRTEVPTPSVTAAIVAKQFLESAFLLKRLAELEEITLSYATLAKLEPYVAQGGLQHPNLSGALAAVGQCIFALYDFHCAVMANGHTRKGDQAWLSPQRNPPLSISPLRTGGDAEQLPAGSLPSGGVPVLPADVERASYLQHRRRLEQSSAAGAAGDASGAVPVGRSSVGGVADADAAAAAAEERFLAEEQGQGHAAASAAAPVARSPSETAVARCTAAARSLRRVSLSDTDRLRSYFSCPAAFQPYCAATALLVADAAPEAFKGRLSPANCWAGLKLLLGRTGLLCQLLSDCDPRDTTPAAAELLERVGTVLTPSNPLSQVSPAALAIANWVVCFFDKWVSMGRPTTADGLASSVPAPPAPPLTPRGGTPRKSMGGGGGGAATPRAFRRELSTVSSRSGAVREPRTNSAVRGRSAGPATDRRGGGGSGVGAALARSRSTTKARGAQQGGGRRSVSTTGRGRSSSAAPRRKSTTAAAEAAAAAAEAPEVVDGDQLEDNLLRCLVDIRTLTTRDLALLATHTPASNRLSKTVQAVVEGLTVITGLGGENPSDGTVDFWAVGTAALQNQPEEILQGVRSLESSVLSGDVLVHIDKLTPLFGLRGADTAPTPYLAVNVLREWLVAMTKYQQYLKSSCATQSMVGGLSQKADAAVAGVVATSPPRERGSNISAIQCETLSPPPPPSIRPAVGDQEIFQWLGEAGLGRYAAVFAEHEIDMATLLLLKESDLVAMGLPIGPKRKVLSLIDGRSE